MNKLGHNLKQLLTDARLSENELAKRIGIAQQVINRLLSGENQNPKLATINAIANYFRVSISQLIGDEQFNKVSGEQTGIPLISWHELQVSSFEELKKHSQQIIPIDLEIDKTNLFAIKIIDTSMEPKFSKDTLLIFDYNQKLRSGDFALFKLDNELMLRQLFIKKDKRFKKSLNPQHEDFIITLINTDINVIGVLVQARTNFIPF